LVMEDLPKIKVQFEEREGEYERKCEIQRELPNSPCLHLRFLRPYLDEKALIAFLSFVKRSADKGICFCRKWLQ